MFQESSTQLTSRRAVELSLRSSAATAAFVVAFGAQTVLADGGRGGDNITSSGGISSPGGEAEWGSYNIRGGGGGGGAGVLGGWGGDTYICLDERCLSLQPQAGAGSPGKPGERDGLGGDGGNGEDELGSTGPNGSGGGGSGGGGGAHGLYVRGNATLPDRDITGGRGGNGGNGSSGGGGGGAGGFGLVLEDFDSHIILDSITGGDAGRGGGGGTGEGGWGGDGGTGLYSSGGSLTIRSEIIGGAGGHGGASSTAVGRAGSGGSGLTIFGGGALIEGPITGGSGGGGSWAYNGGAGIYADSDLLVRATVTGGKGGDPFPGGRNGSGAAGLALNGGRATIESTIIGGRGGTGGTGGKGGTGLSIAAATAVVRSTVRGGDGGAADAIGGTGIVMGLNPDASVSLESGAIVSGGRSGQGTGYAPALELLGGTLKLSPDAIVDGDIVIGDGPCNPACSPSIVRIIPTTAFTHSHRIEGYGILAKEGDGTLTLSASNGFEGTLQLRDGTLALTGNGSIEKAKIVEFSAATLDISGLSGSGTAIKNIISPDREPAMGEIRLGSKNLTVVQDISLSKEQTEGWSLPMAGYFGGRITGTGSLTMDGEAKLELSGENDYTGATIVRSGVLSIAGEANLERSSAVEIDGKLDLSRMDVSATRIGSLSGSASGALDIGDKVVTIQQARDASFAGAISGTGSLVKAGADRLILAGANNYSGTTMVREGTLAVAGSIGGGGIFVDNGATLEGAGGIIAGAVTAGSGATLEGGALTLGALWLDSGSIINATLDQPSLNSLFRTTGALTLDGTLNILDGPAYGAGVYRVFSAGGPLIDNGLSLGNTPDDPFLVARLDVGSQTADVVITAPDTSLQYWSANGISRGGSGTWKEASRWLNLTPGSATPWESRIGIFDGPAGTITVEGGKTFDTLEFLSSGYELKAGSGGALDIDQGGRLWVEGADTIATISAPITGSGTLTKIGAGTIILDSTNSYTGGTNLQAGTLRVAADQAIGSGTLTMDAGTSLDLAMDRLALGNDIAVSGASVINVGGQNTATITGAVSDGLTRGELVKTGRGRLVMTGSNSYSAGTTIKEGALQVGDGGTTGSIAGRIVNDAQLIIDRSDNFAIQGNITGTGALIKAGAGLLTLSGVNTYTGGTVIAGGGLSGDTASLTGNIINNGALTFDQATDGTYSGSISGTGGLTKTGRARLTLEGDNHYLGTTLIEDGTLQIGNGGPTGSIAGNIVNNGALVFNRTGRYDFTGSVSGSGSVSFLGGNVNFSGGSFSGSVSLLDTTMTLASGSVSSALFSLHNDATLRGSGTIGELTVGGGGSVSPGYSPGTIYATGNVVFAPGSTYVVDVMPDGAHDLIAATGAATIAGGNMAVIAGTGSYPETSSYTVLTAQGGVSGQFDSVTSNFAFLSPSLAYGLNDITLTMTRNHVAFDDVAASNNQRAVARAAGTLPTDNKLVDALVRLSREDAPAAFDQLSGEIYASTTSVIGRQSSYLRDAVGSRLDKNFVQASSKDGSVTDDKLVSGTNPYFWLQGYGGWGKVDGNGNAAGIVHDIAGLFAGGDLPVGDHLRVGIVGGYGQSGFSSRSQGSSGTIDNYDLGIYGGGQVGGIKLTAGAAYGWRNVAIERQIAFPGFSGENKAKFDSGIFQLFGEASTRFDFPTDFFETIAVEPFANLTHLDIHADGLSEEGSAAALAGTGADARLFQSTLGLRLSRDFTLSNGASLIPHASLGWQHAFGDLASDASLGFSSGGSGFDVSGVPFDRDMAIIRAGFDYALAGNMTAELSYRGQFGSGGNEQSVKAALHLRF